jgi:hypothetical protein
MIVVVRYEYIPLPIYRDRTRAIESRTNCWAFVTPNPFSLPATVDTVYSISRRSVAKALCARMGQSVTNAAWNIIGRSLRLTLRGCRDLLFGEPFLLMHLMRLCADSHRSHSESLFLTKRYHGIHLGRPPGWQPASDGSGGAQRDGDQEKREWVACVRLEKQLLQHSRERERSSDAEG